MAEGGVIQQLRCQAWEVRSRCRAPSQGAPAARGGAAPRQSATAGPEHRPDEGPPRHRTALHVRRQGTAGHEQARLGRRLESLEHAFWGRCSTIALPRQGGAARQVLVACDRLPEPSPRSGRKVCSTPVSASATAAQKASSLVPSGRATSRWLAYRGAGGKSRRQLLCDLPA